MKVWGAHTFLFLPPVQIQSRLCPLQQVFMFLHEVECSGVTHNKSEVAAGRKAYLFKLKSNTPV
jgi:hypothetical protein